MPEESAVTRVDRSTDFTEAIAREAKALRVARRTDTILCLALPVIGLGSLGMKYIFGASLGDWILIIPVLVGISWLVRVRQRTAANTLVGFEDSRATGPLIEATMSSDRDASEVSRKALMRLLPTLTVSDADHLDDHQRVLLYGILRGRRRGLMPSWNQKEILVVLRAIEQVGDESSIAPVERLTSWKSKELQAAAKNCLVVLRERVDRLRERDTLLRPAQIDPPELLVRPAAGFESQDSSLLRPTLSSDDS